MVRSIDAATWRRVLASDVTRLSGLLLAITVISLLHAATNESEVIWHGLLLRLYYIPILLAAYWYGAFGGLLVAVASSMAYVPHLREQSPAFEAGRYAEIVVFHLIGLTVGLLVDGPTSRDGTLSDGSCDTRSGQSRAEGFVRAAPAG